MAPVTKLVLDEQRHEECELKPSKKPWHAPSFSVFDATLAGFNPSGTHGDGATTGDELS
jgi:hypothetical protein